MHLSATPHPQGTACTALAGLYGAMRVLGRPLSALADQTFVVVGAGSAGMGVTCTIAQGGQGGMLSFSPRRLHRGIATI